MEFVVTILFFFSAIYGVFQFSDLSQSRSTPLVDVVVVGTFRFDVHVRKSVRWFFSNNWVCFGMVSIQWPPANCNFVSMPYKMSSHLLLATALHLIFCFASKKKSKTTRLRLRLSVWAENLLFIYFANFYANFFTCSLLAFVSLRVIFSVSMSVCTHARAKVWDASNSGKLSTLIILKMNSIPRFQWGNDVKESFHFLPFLWPGCFFFVLFYVHRVMHSELAIIGNASILCWSKKRFCVFMLRERNIW